MMEEQSAKTAAYFAKLLEERKLWAEKRSKYLKESYCDLVEAAIPVFISAALSGCIATIFTVISHDLEIKIGLFFIYSFFAYVFGKYTVYILEIDEREKSTNQFLQLIRDFHFHKLIKSVSVEHAGFAMKEFFLLLILEKTFDEYGWGPAFGTFLSLIFFALLLIPTTAITQRVILKFTDELNEIMLSFDTQAFPLPFAFISQSLIAIGFFYADVQFVNSEGYLMSYDTEEVYQPHTDSKNGYYIIYVSITMFLCALLHSKGYINMIITRLQNKSNIEDNPVENSKIDLNTIINPIMEENSFSGASTSTTTRSAIPSLNATHMNFQTSTSLQNLDTKDEKRGSERSSGVLDDVSLGRSSDPGRQTSFGRHSTAESLNWDKVKIILATGGFQGICGNAYVELWDNTLGYFCGVAWFVFIIDTFKIQLGVEGTALSSFLILLVTALIGSWYSPRMLTNIRMNQEASEEKHVARLNRWNSQESNCSNRVDVLTLRNQVGNTHTTTEDPLDLSLSYRTPNSMQATPSNSTVTERVDTNQSIDSRIEKTPWYINIYLECMEFIVGARRLRKSILSLSVKLIVGWLWEVVVSALFYLLGAQDLTLPGLTVLIDIIVTSFIILISIVLFLHVQNFEPVNTEPSNNES